MTRAISILLAVSLLLTFTAACGAAAKPEASSAAVSLTLTSSVDPARLDFTDQELDGTWDDVSAAHITLSETGIGINGEGASADGNTLSINEAGTYILSGTLTDGQILVDAASGDSVRLVLNGVELMCGNSAALYVKQAGQVILTVAEGTENVLSCGEVFSDEAVELGVDGAIYSKADLALNGSGALTVHGGYRHGIVSKDALALSGLSLTVFSVKDGLQGKDCVRIASGSFQISAGGDGIQSNNEEDADRGFVYLAGGSFSIAADCDGIQAETLLCVTGGAFDVTTGGGSAAEGTKVSRTGGNQQEPPDKEYHSGETGGPAVLAGLDTEGLEDESSSSSTKGLKAGAALVITGGTLTVDAFDDAIHCNGDISIGGDAVLILASGDDGIYADASLDVSGGEITVRSSYEGLEGLHLTVSGGTHSITASDDGLNAGGGSDSRLSISEAKQDSFAETSGGETPLMTISGGKLYVNSGGDGLDSNGSLTVSGGELWIDGPTGGGDGALDFGDGPGCKAAVSGGTVVAVGSSGMAVNFDESSSQSSILVFFDSVIGGGTELTVSDSDGAVLLRYTPSKDYQSAVLSSPDLKSGETYTISAGENTVSAALSGVTVTAGSQTGGMGFRGGAGDSRPAGDAEPPTEGPRPQNSGAAPEEVALPRENTLQNSVQPPVKPADESSQSE